MASRITVIGGANIDISATMNAPFVPGDSIPGQVTLGSGGVARNIAHNLLLLGNEVAFVGVFGDDVFGKICHEQCAALGLDLTLSECCVGQRNGLYLCVNNSEGDMVTAVADMDILGCITPQFLAERIEVINRSSIVVTDTNLDAPALQYLMDHCTAPLVVDTVSTAKAPRVVEALCNSGTRRLHTLKLNRQEALAVTPCNDVADAAAWLLEHGVGQVFVSLGSEGVYCANAEYRELLPAQPVAVVNTTGAGDAFVAAVVHGMVLGMTMTDCASLGQRAARAALVTPHAVNPDLPILMGHSPVI